MTSSNYTPYRSIRLGRGSETTIVDADYFEHLSNWKWHLRSGYPVRAIYLSLKPRKKTHVSMHRIVAGAQDGDTVDHINGDPLDNRRSNIRICEQFENARNRKIQGGSSKYKGSVFDNKSGLYSCQIRIDKILKYLGLFRAEEDAAKCYNAAAIEFFGKYARLNPVDVSGESWQEISIKETHARNITNKSSRYIGVSLQKYSGRWIASFTKEEMKPSYLGIFTDEIDAALCVDAAIYKMHGNDRVRNFPLLHIDLAMPASI